MKREENEERFEVRTTWSEESSSFRIGGRRSIIHCSALFMHWLCITVFLQLFPDVWFGISVISRDIPTQGRWSEPFQGWKKLYPVSYVPCTYSSSSCGLHTVQGFRCCRTNHWRCFQQCTEKPWYFQNIYIAYECTMHLLILMLYQGSKNHDMTIPQAWLQSWACQVWERKRSTANLVIQLSNIMDNDELYLRW